MKHCTRCDIDIAGRKDFCPLCHAPLSGTNYNLEEIFPEVHTVYYNHTFFFKLLLAVSISGGLITLLVNQLVSGRLTWAIIVLAGIACMWLSLLLIINKRKNIIKCVLYQVIVASLLVLPWDYFTGWHGWSIDFAMPILYVALMLAIVVLAKVTHQNLRNQVWYFFLTVLFGLVQAILLVAGAIHYVIPSYICAIVSLLSLVLILVFNGKDILSQIDRRLHV